jgi:ABC-2 type transport system permease protein
VQPLLFLFVLGSGLQQLVEREHPRGRPQDLHLSRHPVHRRDVHGDVLGASIVWDREFGFLREMMVAPVRRSSIVIGKCLGGATVASLQGVILICLAGSSTCPTTRC